MKSKLLFCIIGLLLMAGCHGSQRALDFEKVKIGYQLKLADQISVNEFFQIWISNSARQTKVDLECYELYRDNNYMYFGENVIKVMHVKQMLYRVNNDSIELYFPNYQNVSGDIVRERFWAQVIPAEYQIISEIRNREGCASGGSNGKYTFTLINNQINIRFDWVYKCDGKKIIDDAYEAYYDLSTEKIITN